MGSGHVAPHVPQINAHLGYPRYNLPGSGASPIASSSESLAHSPQLRHQVIVLHLFTVHLLRPTSEILITLGLMNRK